MKKYYFCILLCMSTLNAMDSSDDCGGTPPSSLQWSSAPSSPVGGKIQYNRDTLLALQKSPFAKESPFQRSKSGPITFLAIIKPIEDSNPAEDSKSTDGSVPTTSAVTEATQPLDNTVPAIAIATEGEKPKVRKIIIRRKQPHDKN